MNSAHPIRGVLTAMATPFAEGGAVDFDGAAALARHLVDQGSHGVVVAGTTGESPTLDDSEKLALLAAVLDEVGDRSTVICGTGSNDTRHTVELTRAAAEVGAHGALIVAPYYNKPSAAGIEAHFEQAAAAAPELPILVYNIPARVVVNIDPELLGRLARIENVVAVKQANDDELLPIPGLDLLAGNDEVFLRTLEIGGAGGILVASHLAGPSLRAIWDRWQAGDRESAAEINAGLEPLFAALNVATNPIPVKAALQMTGLDSGRMRLPMVPAGPEQREVIRRELSRLNILEDS